MLPLASVAFLFRWLLIRLMWGFAKLKFVGTEKGDGLYLQGFLTWLPMPTPLGWFAQHAPPWALRLGCLFMWVAEVLAPLLACFPGTPRLIGASLLVMLMLGIWATGNWGHFNLAYAGLCIVFLDHEAQLSDALGAGSAALGGFGGLLTHGVLLALFLASLVMFPLNSWVNQSTFQWNADRLAWGRPVVQRLAWVLRAINRLRLVGAYGVFPPNTSPPIKMVPVMEGSHDGVQWTPIPWRFMPVGERSPPRFIAPHHPRLDHSCIYAGLGLNEADAAGGMMFEVKPYGMSPYGPASWLHRVVQRVLEGEPSVLRLLGKNPFPGQPPRLVRVVHQCLKPTSLAERRRSGRWWHARSMCVLHEPVSSDPGLWERWIPLPEAVHPELSHWRRGSPALASLREVVAEGGPTAENLCVDSDLCAADVRQFWERFVPAVKEAENFGNWDSVLERAAELRIRFTASEMRCFEQVHQRSVHLLEVRAEPFVYGSHEPRWHVEHAYQLLSQLGVLVFEGEQEFLRDLADPARMIPRVAELDDATLLYPLALFRPDMLRALVLSLRARTALSRAPDMPFGIGRYKDFLLSRCLGAQWFPECNKTDSGVWTVDPTGFAQGGGLPRAPEVGSPPLATS